MKRIPTAYWVVSILLLGVLSGCGGGGGGGGTGGVTGSSPQPLGSAHVYWSAPISNVDNTPLNDLVGYRVYYGTISPLTKGNSLAVNVDNVTEYLIPNLSSGNYFFSVTAVDSAGNESDLSNIGSKNIP